MKIIPGFVSANALAGMTSHFTTSIKKLSVGLRGDVAPERRDGLRARVSVVDGTCGNIQDGISLFRLSGKALDDIRESLGNAREIFRRAQAGELTDTDRAEVVRIVREIDEKAGRARFKGVPIFRASHEPVELAEHTDEIVSELTQSAHRLDVAAMPLLEMTASALGVEGLERDPGQAISRLDGAIGTVASSRAVLEAQTVKMESAASKLMVKTANVVAAGSRIMDADRARAVVATAKLGILKKAGLSLAGQANQKQRNVIALMQ